MSEFLVRLAILGELGVSGSQLKVVKLSASEGIPLIELDSACTLWDQVVLSGLLFNSISFIYMQVVRYLSNILPRKLKYYPEVKNAP